MSINANTQATLEAVEDFIIRATKPNANPKEILALSSVLRVYLNFCRSPLDQCTQQSLEDVAQGRAVDH